MASDSKVIQSLVNTGSKASVLMREAIAVLQQTRDDYLALDPAPDRTGTPLEGPWLGMMNQAIINIDNLVNVTDKAVWDGLEDSFVPTHTSEAI